MYHPPPSIPPSSRHQRWWAALWQPAQPTSETWIALGLLVVVAVLAIGIGMVFWPLAPEGWGLGLALGLAVLEGGAEVLPPARWRVTGILRLCFAVGILPALGVTCWLSGL